MERYGRQAKLAEVGATGQARIAAATVDVRLRGVAAADVAARYLAGAGVAALRVREAVLADGAQAIAPGVQIEVDPLDASLSAHLAPVAVATAGDDEAEAFAPADPSARELALGALAALRALGAVLAGPR